MKTLIKKARKWALATALFGQIVAGTGAAQAITAPKLSTPRTQTATATGTATGNSLPGPRNNTATQTGTATSTGTGFPGKGPGQGTSTATNTHTGPGQGTSTSTHTGPSLPGNGTSTGTNTGTGPKPGTSNVPGPQPTGQNAGFTPVITIEKITNKENTSESYEFYNGIFIDDENGGDYQVCGLVKDAKDLQLNNQGKAFIEIDGKKFPLDATAGGRYKFCGNVTLKDQDGNLPGENRDRNEPGKKDDKIDAQKLTLAKFFNNFLVTLTNNKGQTARNRFTVINSESRAIDDNEHVDAVEIVLDAQGSANNNINDYLTHAARDFVLSNEELFGESVEDKYREVTGSCNMDIMFDNLQDQKGWFASLLMQIFEGFYGLTHDIDGDEEMYLCYNDFEIGDSDLKVTLGDSDKKMINVSGGLKNVKLKLSFKHSSDGVFTDYHVLEQGTLVIKFGRIDIAGYAGGLGIDEGQMEGSFTIDSVKVTGGDAYWENWEVDDVWYETANSGMDEMDDKIDDKLAQGISSTEDEVKALDRELDNEELVIDFIPSAKNLVMLMETFTSELPEDLTSSYTKQDAYRSTSIGGAYEFAGHSEVGMAMDDDILNQMMLFKTLEGAFAKTMTQTMSDGKTATIKFKADIAPVITMGAADEIETDEEGNALRMDLANAGLSIVIGNSPVPVEYAVDVAVALSMYDSGDQIVAIDLEDSAISFIPLKGTPLPDKTVEQILVKAVNQMIEKMESVMNEQLADKMNTVFDSMPLDVCTDVNWVIGQGSDNFFAGVVDLSWSTGISRTDSCFKMPVNESSGQPTQTSGWKGCTEAQTDEGLEDVDACNPDDVYDLDGDGETDTDDKYYDDGF